MFNGFNKGFSLGFAGRVFNRGFSTKILSITRTTEVIEETTADITGTPFLITSPGTFTVSYDTLSGGGQTAIIIAADASQYSGQQIVVERIGTNTNANCTIYYNTNGENNVPLSIGQTITFTSNGNVWSTGSDGLGGITPPDDGLSGPGDGGPAPP